MLNGTAAIGIRLSLVIITLDAVQVLVRLALNTHGLGIVPLSRKADSAKLPVGAFALQFELDGDVQLRIAFAA